jgi:cation diffusion facilitator family transporter
MQTTGDGGANPGAHQEKHWVALSSVVAAIFLTGMKLVVGLMTGSLGILSEAAHSGLDLVAAVVTFFAVRISGQPADREHTYGHGKVENLSALFETVLLLVTCVWIMYEAVQRLFFKEVAVEASVWAFVIMGISIVVDFSRSRALARVAKKYDSQALEADALHFSTDIWSSSVVIGGLLLVRGADWLGLPWLAKADAVAAMGVAGIVVYVSVQLGQRTIAALLDAVPGGVRDQIVSVIHNDVEGVLGVTRVRVRRSGPEAFADVTLKVSRDVPFERAHDIAARAEAAVRRILPAADVVVHVDPVRAQDEGTVTTVRLLAEEHGLNAHDIHVYDVAGRRSLAVHLEVSQTLCVGEAHEKATKFEQDLRAALPGIDQIVTHIEPAGDETALQRATPTEKAQVLQALKSLRDETGITCQPHDLMVHRVAGELTVSFHCVMSADAAITDAHSITERVEQRLRAQVPNLGQVMIHVEPPNGEP